MPTSQFLIYKIQDFFSFSRGEQKIANWIFVGARFHFLPICKLKRFREEDIDDVNTQTLMGSVRDFPNFARLKGRRWSLARNIKSGPTWDHKPPKHEWKRGLTLDWNWFGQQQKIIMKQCHSKWEWNWRRNSASISSGKHLLIASLGLVMKSWISI